LLCPYIQKKQTRFRPTIPSDLRLAIFLFHIAQGDGYTSVSIHFAVGTSTVSTIIGDVSKAIVRHLSSEHIRFPNVDEAMRSMEHWQVKSGMPGVVACVEGCHIPILQPACTGSTYFNRKGFYSINVQGTTLLRIYLAKF
jgi:hypothetical protein